MKEINISEWKRKKQYEFFKDYDDPFFNICADVEITGLLNFCKENKISFFIASLYLSQKAINEIDELKYRIKEDKVWFFDKINSSSTILNDDETFRFCYFDQYDNFQEFYKSVENVLKLSKNELLQSPYGGNVVYYSVIPWVSFSSFSHAKKHSEDDSIPRIVFGKYYNSEGRILMPVSIEVHHALVDGIHVGKYFEKFSSMCKNPSTELI